MRQTPRSWVKGLVLLAALAGVLLTASLGRWQMGRAAQKQAIAQAREARATQPVLDARRLQGLDETALQALIHRRVVLQGRWRAEHTVWLENRQMQGRTGFYVYTPMQLEGSHQVVLVQRGWAPRNFMDRTALPQIETPAGPVSIQGRLLPWPSRVYEFAPAEDTVIRQNLVLEDYRRQTGLPLQALSVQQTDADAQGLQRAWPEAGSGVEKHHGYAFQWFALSALLVGLTLWFQFFRPRLRSGARGSVPSKPAA